MARFEGYSGVMWAAMKLPVLIMERVRAAARSDFPRVLPRTCREGSMRHPRPEGHRFRGYLFPTLVAPLLVAVASSGQASSWQPLGPYGGAVESIAIDPSQPSTLYAGVSGVGIFKSTDGASHWEKTWLRESTSYSAVAVSWADSDRVYAATLSGFYLSDDGGQTWAPSNQGLSGTHPGRYLTALALHPSDPNTLFVGGGWGEASQRARMAGRPGTTARVSSPESGCTHWSFIRRQRL